MCALSKILREEQGFLIISEESGGGGHIQLYSPTSVYRTAVIQNNLWDYASFRSFYSTSDLNSEQNNSALSL